MKKGMMIQCGKCVYFRINLNDRERDLDQQHGTCHRRPPYVVPQDKGSGYLSVFPSVSGADFCGECVEGTCPFEKASPKYATGFGYASTRTQG